MSKKTSEWQKLTDKHFAVFETEVWHWMQFFGLTQWSTIVEWSEREDCLADCHADIVNRSAEIGLARRWPANEPINEHVLCQYSFHETGELLLSHVAQHLQQRFSFEVVQELLHGVIRTLENSVFEADYQRRHAAPTEQTPFGEAIVVSPDKVVMSQGEDNAKT